MGSRADSVHCVVGGCSIVGIEPSFGVSDDDDGGGSGNDGNDEEEGSRVRKSTSSLVEMAGKVGGTMAPRVESWSSLSETSSWSIVKAAVVAAVPEPDPMAVDASKSEEVEDGDSRVAVLYRSRLGGEAFL